MDKNANLKEKMRKNISAPSNMPKDLERNKEYLGTGIKVSVVIPCYNHGKLLMGGILSVLKSNFEDYEIIIVDDGSTDPLTLEIFKNLEEKFQHNHRVQIIHQDNLGLADARNNAIMMSKGEYILPLDADNRIRPDYLSKAVEILDNNPEIGVVYAYAKTFGDEDPYAKLFGGKKGVRKFQAFDGKTLLVNNFIDACSVLRKKVWEDCNGYDPDMGIMGYEDWDLWIGAMEKGWKFHLIKEALFDYYIDSNSMISGCNIPENRRHLIRYICKKHKDSYIKNLEHVIAEKDVRILLAESRLIACMQLPRNVYVFIEALRILRSEGISGLIRRVKEKVRCRMIG
jgi:glycosyltransferase involved in cell wall biosynthesis